MFSYLELNNSIFILLKNVYQKIMKWNYITHIIDISIVPVKSTFRIKFFIMKVLVSKGTMGRHHYRFLRWYGFSKANSGKEKYGIF